MSYTDTKIKLLTGVLALLTLVFVVFAGMVAHRLDQIGNSFRNVYYQLDRHQADTKQLKDYLWPK